jgi:hypothetical protein
MHRPSAYLLRKVAHRFHQVQSGIIPETGPRFLLGKEIQPLFYVLTPLRKLLLHPEPGNPGVHDEDPVLGKRGFDAFYLQGSFIHQEKIIFPGIKGDKIVQRTVIFPDKARLGGYKPVQKLLVIDSNLKKTLEGYHRSHFYGGRGRQPHLLGYVPGNGKIKPFDRVPQIRKNLDSHLDIVSPAVLSLEFQVNEGSPLPFSQVRGIKTQGIVLSDAYGNPNMPVNGGRQE